MKLARELGFVAVAAALLLAGCGGSSSTPKASSGPSILTIANSTEISGLDPDIRVSSANARVTTQIFQSLFNLGPQGQLIPVLATSAKNLTPTSWEFTLRKGVKFQDGTPWNAQAFVDNIHGMFDPSIPSNVSSALPTILPNDVTIVNPYTVIVHTKVPDAVLPHRFAQYWVTFASPKVIDGHSETYVNEHPVGTGPFKFVTWKKDNYLELKSWKGYWGNQPKVQEIKFKPIADSQTRVQLLESGGVDIAVDVPVESISSINSSQGTKIMTAPGGTMNYFVYLDGRSGGPLANVAVRLALNYAVDRQALVKQLLGGQATPIGTPVTPQAFGYDPSIKPYQYNVQKAKELLGQAGYPQGFTTTIAYAPGFSPNESQVVQALQQYFAKVGVTVKLQPMDFPTFLSDTLLGKLHGMFFIGKVNNIMDADGLWSDLAPGTPFGQYNPLSPTAMQLWQKERSTFNTAQRKQLDFQLQQYIHQNPNFVMLYQMNQIYGVSSKVQGFQPTADGLLHLTGVSVSK